jgi:hypothetical protein
MRADRHPSHPSATSFIEGIVQAVSEVASVLQLLGDLIAPMTHTVKETDHSEPPDVGLILQPA